MGAVYRLQGHATGLTLDVREAVTEYEPGRRKVWRTLGEPRLVVLGPYEMGFEVRHDGVGSRLDVWVDYDLSRGRRGQILGRLLGAWYARWCLRAVGWGVQHAFATRQARARGSPASRRA